MGCSFSCSVIKGGNYKSSNLIMLSSIEGWTRTSTCLNHQDMRIHNVQTSFTNWIKKYMDLNKPLELGISCWNFLVLWGLDDISLFIYHHGTSLILLLVYVDDVVSKGCCLDKLAGCCLKDLGLLNYFLGIQVTNFSTSILLTQSKYIDDMLPRLSMENLKHGPFLIVEQTLVCLWWWIYKWFVSISKYTFDAFQYLTKIRLNIAYIFNHLS